MKYFFETMMRTMTLMYCINTFDARVAVTCC